jgi:hypothetical protein
MKYVLFLILLSSVSLNGQDNYKVKCAKAPWKQLIHKDADYLTSFLELHNHTGNMYYSTELVTYTPHLSNFREFSIQARAIRYIVSIDSGILEGQAKHGKQACVNGLEAFFNNINTKVFIDDLKLKLATDTNLSIKTKMILIDIQKAIEELYNLISSIGSCYGYYIK